MAIELSALTTLDAHGYEVLDAITFEGRRAPTHSAAHTFICIDGRTYWVKGRAQQGLVTELICGRLASRVGAGPLARIVRVTADAAAGAGSTADHLLGVVVGIEDEKNGINIRDLATLAPTFDPRLVDAASRALVVAFQTWIGVGDTQALLNTATGRIASIDHGECFMATGAASSPQLTVLSIAGVPDNHGSDHASVDAAAARIEAVTDQHLVDAVTRIPLGDDPWKSPANRRLEIANWLAGRRGQVRKVLSQWQ